MVKDVGFGVTFKCEVGGFLNIKLNFLRLKLNIFERLRHDFSRSRRLFDFRGNSSQKSRYRSHFFDQDTFSN